ncbi:prolipoprotein diacylglyceryl transferase family protein [Spiroplasma taiwanense]|uniref:Prolipoprotein diacylglyceryl transferase n=1 Tax=Spiroplasma taiwanense CT-1 TaxID=1276220 RepID=S5LSX3_9MOLU|nr:prolipoprotein diacylglyceryl transferase family protein [Spiroplasma taiwanense]AGR40769.1 prolipoprotein diacylglyceryl transferase [Spiroplasma taiwanense CT-1]
MFLNWNSKDWSAVSDMWTVRDDYGFFHVYAFTMTIGVISAISISAIKLYIKGVPLKELWIGASIIVPFSLLGASFFGKLNADGPGQNAQGTSFWGLFAFWKAGMAIHGGVYCGALVGIVIFYFLGRKTRVSLWTYGDAIIPNILIGQGIGRWGNFFNHELYGQPIAKWFVESSNEIKQTNALSWLPQFIRENMVWEYRGSGGSLNGLELISGEKYLMAPIFLYESFFLILSWAIITFLISFIGRWFGKKPWKINPEKYSFNLKVSYIWKQAVFANHDEKNVNEYNENINQIKDSNWIKRKWKQGELLVTTNNPYKYLTVKAGVEMGVYFFSWNIVRLILEIDRAEDHLFLMYQRGLSLALISLTAILGIILIIIAQWVSPYLFRQPGYVYEQEYFYTKAVIEKIVKDKSVSNEKKLKQKLKEKKIKEKLEKKMDKK